MAVRAHGRDAGPTAFGVPLITAWITYYKIRFRGAAGARAEAVTTR